METQQFLVIGAILALLVLSAFFSGSETSLTAASRARMHTLQQQGNARAALVNRLWERKDKLIGAILLGNNLVNILASALATSLLISLVGDTGVAYATLGMTLLVLIFSEVLPKTYALHHADRMALVVAPNINVAIFLFSPVTRLVQLVVTGTLHLFGAKFDATYGTERWEEEVRGAIELHHDRGAEENREERDMLRSILDLGDVEVGEIMVHRRNVLAIDSELPPEKIIEQVLESPYTRIPLWRGKFDDIVGVLHVKALLRAVQARAGKVEGLDVGAIAAEPWFIPDSTDLLSQLRAFRHRKEHFAIVVDEYGEVLGIVTLEDILEEIVGEISDEHDVKVAGVEILSDGSAVVHGSVTLRDLNRHSGWRLPDEEASTVAGLILHEARCIPEIGQRFAFHGFAMEILGRQRNQITLVKIARLGEEEKAGEQEPEKPGSDTAA
ncbi:MAG: HlyC/CorC family transporter [Tistlia sp.]